MKESTCYKRNLTALNGISLNLIRIATKWKLEREKLRTILSGWKDTLLDSQVQV